MDGQTSSSSSFFYCRYYSGHTGKFGHEFLEFEVDKDGTLRYSNSSGYRGAPTLKKQVTLTPAVMSEMKRLVDESRITAVDDAQWPMPDRGGRQELEICSNGVHLSLCTNKISQQAEIAASKDPEGLQAFLFLVQDLRTMALTLISLHHKIRPVNV